MSMKKISKLVLISTIASTTLTAVYVENPFKDELQAKAKTSATHITTENVKFRKSASLKGKLLFVLKKGNKVKVLSTKKVDGMYWSKVQWQDSVGWIAKNYLKKYQASKTTSTTKTTSATKTTTVKETVSTTANVNMRKSASTKTSILVTIPKNTKVTITKTITINNVKWAYGSYNGKKGWISYAYLKKYQVSKTPSASTTTATKTTTVKETVSTTANVNMRKSASTTTSILVTIPKDTKITITKIATIGNVKWAYGSYNGKKGWISYAYLNKATTNASIDKQELTNSIVIDEYTNLYNEPDNNSSIIAIIPEGLELEIKETKIIKKVKWAKVQSKYLEGWIVMPTLKN